MDRIEIEARLAFWQGVYSKLQQAYIALIDGGVQSYTIDDRSLQRFDLPIIKKQMDEAETEISQLTELLRGGARRKAFAILPRDW